MRLTNTINFGTIDDLDSAVAAFAHATAASNSRAAEIGLDKARSLTIDQLTLADALTTELNIDRATLFTWYANEIRRAGQLILDPQPATEIAPDGSWISGPFGWAHGREEILAVYVEAWAAARAYQVLTGAMSDPDCAPAPIRQARNAALTALARLDGIGETALMHGLYRQADNAYRALKMRYSREDLTVEHALAELDEKWT